MEYYLFLEDQCFGIKEGDTTYNANYTNVISSIEC